VTHVLAPARLGALVPHRQVQQVLSPLGVDTPGHKRGLFHPLGPVDGKIASQEHLLNHDPREVSRDEGLIVLERGNR